MRRGARGRGARSASSRRSRMACPSGRRRRSRISRPSSVRIGMFWRFGSRRREAPRRRDGLLEAGVDAPGPRVHGARERVDVRPLQLVDLAVAHDDARQLVLLGELLEDRGVGRPPPLRGALQHRELELVEEDRLELVARANREVAPGDPLRLGVELLRAPPRSTCRWPASDVDVDEHPRPLHLREHAREGQLDVAQERAEPFLVDPRLESARRATASPRPRPPRSRVARSTSTSSNASCGAALLARGLVVGRELEAQLAPRQLLQRARRLRIEEVARRGSVSKIGPGERELEAMEEHFDRLQVVRDLLHLRVDEQRRELARHVRPVELRRARRGSGARPARRPLPPRSSRARARSRRRASGPGSTTATAIASDAALARLREDRGERPRVGHAGVRARGRSARLAGDRAGA